MKQPLSSFIKREKSNRTDCRLAALTVSRGPVSEAGPGRVTEPERSFRNARKISR